MTDSSSTAGSDDGDGEPRVLFYVQALVDYQPGLIRDTAGALEVLSFREGDTIGVTNWDDDVWWEGCVVDPSGPLPLPISTVGTFPQKFSGGELVVERISSWGALAPEPEPEPEPSFSAPALEILVDGTLEKNGSSWPRRWHERYFVLLRDGHLKYWKTRADCLADQPPRGHLAVDGTTEATVIDGQRFAFLLTAITLTSASPVRRTLTLRAGSQTEVDRWLQSMRELGTNRGVDQITAGGANVSNDDDLTRQFSTEHLAALRRVKAEHEAQMERWRAEDARRNKAKLDSGAAADDIELRKTMSQIETAEQARLTAETQKTFLARCEREGLTKDDVLLLEQEGLTCADLFPRDDLVSRRVDRLSNHACR